MTLFTVKCFKTEDELKIAINSIVYVLEKPVIGTVMGELKKLYAGKFDGKLASQLIKERLQ